VRGSGYLFSSDQIILPEPDEDEMFSDMASVN
jgi:hypothetical protein